MTTMSGSKRRACSIASATLPASATTWNPSRRSSRATRPCRTTSWSSTIRSRSVFGDTGGTRVGHDGLAARGEGQPHDDTRAHAPARSRWQACRPGPPRDRAGWRARSARCPGAAGDRIPPRRPRCEGWLRPRRHARDSARSVRPAVAGDVAEGLAGDLEQLVRAPPGGAAPRARGAPDRSRVMSTSDPASSSATIASMAPLSPPSPPDPSPTMNRPDVTDRRVQAVDRPVDPCRGLGRVIGDQSRARPRARGSPRRCSG